jgi:hypothetical protein
VGKEKAGGRRLTGVEEKAGGRRLTGVEEKAGGRRLTGVEEKAGGRQGGRGVDRRQCPERDGGPAG